jgi:acyl-CoA hydrolase
MNKTESLTTMAVMPSDLNSNGKLFGGQLLKWMDEQAFICATKNTGKHIVTVGVEKVKFLNPAKNGDLIEILSKITSMSGATMTIEINAFINFNNNIKPVATAKFRMAAVDENGHPIKIR